MLANVTTFAIDGVVSRRLAVEVDLHPGLPAFTIVGLADRAVRESRERVRAAIQNSGFRFPQSRVTDHRIGLTLHKLDAVMNGEIDEIIDALTLAEQAELLEQENAAIV